MTRVGAFSTAGVLGVGLLLGGSVASAAAQYGISAQLKSTGTLQSGSSQISVRANLTAKSQSQSSTGLTMRSHIDIPFGCASDTIFENGFDP